jgi:hypothetical protein
MLARRFFYYFCITFLLATSTSTSALPLIFQFTGKISDTVLISGIDQTLYTTHPEWNGKVVTGQLIFSDLSEFATDGYNGPFYSRYSKSNDFYPYANWMSFIINNPDGTVLDISDSVPVVPVPLSEGDDAYTEISDTNHWEGDTTFYAQRSYSNSSTYPQKHASLYLRAINENAQWLTENANYNEVIVRPEFANFFNYGAVYYYTDIGVGHEYYFKIESIERLQATVTEPSTFLIFVASLLLITLKNSRIMFVRNAIFCEKIVSIPTACAS